jgi:uncharacterized protein YcgL (UPF0745 family)
LRKCAAVVAAALYGFISLAAAAALATFIFRFRDSATILLINCAAQSATKTSTRDEIVTSTGWFSHKLLCCFDFGSDGIPRNR